MNTEKQNQSYFQKLLAHKYTEDKDTVISYKLLRRCIGWLGATLPFALVIVACLYQHCVGCDRIQGSLSDYHNTFARDVFVGFLSSISIFLFAYKGISRLDNILASITGILGFIVAFFPTEIKYNLCTIYPCPTCVDHSDIYLEWVGTLHIISAALFILLLGFFSFYIFTQPDRRGKPNTKERERRINIYKACGITIFVCVAILIAYFAYFHFFRTDSEREQISQKYKVVLIFECISIWAFAFSWMVKGEGIKPLNNKPNEKLSE